MSAKDDGGPAFPSPSGNKSGLGRLSVRDWFAAHALAGICADPESGGTSEQFARTAYEFADAMLAERAK